MKNAISLTTTYSTMDKRGVRAQVQVQSAGFDPQTGRMTKETTCYVEVSEQDALDLMVKLGAFVHLQPRLRRNAPQVEPRVCSRARS